jgi:peptidoglycan/LPS O-acetylase OafA/YrhL
LKEAKPLGLSRISNFDGLRGAASLVVVLHHLLLTLPWFADRVGFGELGPRGEFELSFHRLFEYTPLHVFYGGTEAVVVFFVLSGYVLTYAIAGEKSFGYLRLRLVRLYAPIIMSSVLASLFIVLVQRKPQPLGSWWLNSHAVQFEITSFIRNLLVIDGTDWMNSSLWSMRYEILFSMAILVLVTVHFTPCYKKFIASFCFLVSVIFIAVRFNFDLASWLPVFFAGTVIHFLPIRKYLTGVPEALFGIWVMFIPWYFAGFGYSLSTALSRIVMTCGAVLIVDSCRYKDSKLTSLLSSRSLKFAGKYSYSLYLIHAPALTTVWFLFGATDSNAGWILRSGASCALIAIGTLIVYKFAEQPSLKWIKNQREKSKIVSTENNL